MHDAPRQHEETDGADEQQRQRHEADDPDQGAAKGLRAGWSMEPPALWMIPTVLRISGFNERNSIQHGAAPATKPATL
jgi:hypothetical protein